jgi:hypothetical protein
MEDLPSRPQCHNLETNLSGSFIFLMEVALPTRDTKKSNLENNLVGHPQIHLLETMVVHK